MKLHYVILLTIILFSACMSSTKTGITYQPTLADYQVGEKWIWKYKGVTTEGEVRSDDTDKRMIVQSALSFPSCKASNTLLNKITFKDLEKRF